jgi:undecaprenyl diphosphate synthase
MQSAPPPNPALHVAIIMDGNGRWATRRGLQRSDGHRAGVEALRRVVEAAPGLGIGTLTLFAFSADNWRRPAEEVEALMWLLRAYLRAEAARLVESGARLSVIGRRDRLSAKLCREITRAERATAAGRRLHLRVALDYSSRDAILRAAIRAAGLEPTLDAFSRLVSQAPADDPSPCAVDLLIRTGGEKRLSDFLLWESAYAELYFTDCMWPDFDGAELATALADFRRRERRFGGVPAAPALAVAQ